MLQRLLVQEITLLLREQTGTDEFGDPTYTESQMAVKGLLQNTVSYEQPGVEAPQESHGRLFLHADAPLNGWDAVMVDGERWEVDGPPRREYRPLAFSYHHIITEVRRGG
jgi:hypothetical protein